MEGTEDEEQERGTIINAEDEHFGETARDDDLSPATVGPKEPAEQEEESCPSVDSEEVAAAVAPIPPSRLREQEKLRDQLQKLVSHKLSQGGELDQAGIAALEALSKLPPPPGSSSSSSIPPPGRSTMSRSSSGGHRGRRHLPPGVESLPKFNGANPSVLTDTLARFNALVVNALPGSSAEQVNRALLRDVINVLEGAGLKFYNDLMNGRVEWEPVAPGVEAGAEQPTGGRKWSPPILWVQVCDAFHDNFLPAEGIARTARALLSLKQVLGESVPNLAGRHLSLSHHLSRLVVANGNQTAFWEAMSIALFEQGLRPDLKRAQDAGPPCSTFQESVDRADRIATTVAAAAAAAADVRRVVNGKDGAVVGAVGAASASSAIGATIDHSAGGADIELRGKDHQMVEDASYPGTAPAGLQPQPIVAPAAAPHHPLTAVASPPLAVSDTDVSGVGRPSSSSSANGNAFEPVAPRTGGGLVVVKCEVGADDYKPAVAKANIGGIITTAAAPKIPLKLSSSNSSSGRGGPSISSNRSGMHRYYEEEARAGLVSATSQLGGGAGNPLDDGGFSASNHFGGGGIGEEARVSALREPSQYSGSRRGKNENGRASQLRGDESRSPSSRRKPNKRQASANAKRRWEWEDPNTDGGRGSRGQHPRLEATAADRPPCTLPQCQSINRQFHCANDCFYHLVNGEQNRLRYEARQHKSKRSFRMQPEPMGYDGYYGDDHHQNQGPRYDRGFAGLH